VLFVGLLLALALVVGPVAVGSIYAGYKDVFANEDDATVPSPAYR
jgi:hypothetical protein